MSEVILHENKTERDVWLENIRLHNESQMRKMDKEIRNDDIES